MKPCNEVKPYNKMCGKIDFAGSQTQFGNPFINAPRPATLSIATGIPNLEVGNEKNFFISNFLPQKPPFSHLNPRSLTQRGELKLSESKIYFGSLGVLSFSFGLDRY
jgi:hypothetical protein